MTKIIYTTDALNASNISGLETIDLNQADFVDNRISLEASSAIQVTNISQNITNLYFCFGRCYRISETFDIPDNVTNIDYIFYNSAIKRGPKFGSGITNWCYHIFKDCVNLVYPPDLSRMTNVTGLYGAFENCVNMKTAPALNINRNYSEYYGFDNIFNGCRNMTTAPNLPSPEKPAGVSIVRTFGLNQAFYECHKMQGTPNIPYGTPELYFTFTRCKAMENAPIIPDTVTSMQSTFYGCESMVEPPTIPNSVIYMPSTFGNCKSMRNMPDIPSSLTDLGSTFINCTNITTIKTLPSSINSLSSTFAGCTGLTSFPTFSDSVVAMSGTFARCTQMVNTPTLPANVTTIASLYNGCVNVVNVAPIPQKVVYMNSTFENCTSLLNAPIIPASVNYAANLFKNCVSLTGNVVIQSQNVVNCNGIFNGLEKNVNVYIPIEGDTQLYGWTCKTTAPEGYLQTYYSKALPAPRYTNLFDENGVQQAKQPYGSPTNRYMWITNTSLNYARNTAADKVIHLAQCATYESLINEGYSTSTRTNGVLLFDINSYSG